MPRLTAINDYPIDETIRNDYKTAAEFDKMKVGSTGVFFPHNLSVKYIPFSYIEQAFIRINEVNGRLCCGNASFYYYRLVLVHAGKEVIDYLTEKEEVLDRALAAIAAAAPNIKIGYDKKEEQ